MPYISQSFIDDLSNQVDIVDLIGKRLPLKKTGSDYRAPCPFHKGKNRNFAVNSHKQFYHCFKCGESGGAISFVQKFDNLSFVEAIETIASEFSLNIQYDNNTKPVDSRIGRYQDLMQRVGDFYIQQLKQSRAKTKALNYAKTRGISDEIMKRFEIGFAPPGNKNLLTHFSNNTQDSADLKTLDLLKTGGYGDYDFFRDRFMFPIHNGRGKIIAFGGRAFDDKTKAKYLNSSESLIFSKSKELYGIYQLRKYSHSINYILVVEGYMDVLALHQAGITSVLATLGTTTSAQHLQILSRTTNTIIFCFDGDSAGRIAAWKALKVALPVIKAGLIIKFLFMPNGEDPDSLIKKESAKTFEKRVESAHTLSKFLFDHIKTQVDFTTIEGQTAFLEKVLVLIQQVNYEIYQQQLIEGVAKMMGKNSEKIKEIFEKTKNTAPKTIHAVTSKTKQIDTLYYKSTTKSPMSKMIKLLLNYPILADDIAEARIRNIEKSQVLLELVHSAQMDKEISPQDLIQPFKGRASIYQRLQELCILEPRLSEVEAKKDFLTALDSAERCQEKAKIKALISQANTLEEEKRVMQGIQKSKNVK